MSMRASLTGMPTRVPGGEDHKEDRIDLRIAAVSIFGWLQFLVSTF